MLTMTPPNNRVEATRKTARLTRAVMPALSSKGKDFVYDSDEENKAWQSSHCSMVLSSRCTFSTIVGIMSRTFTSNSKKEAVIAIPTGDILEGSLKPNKLKLVQAWIEIHQDDLLADWELASVGESVFKIDPLK